MQQSPKGAEVNPATVADPAVSVLAFSFAMVISRRVNGAGDPAGAIEAGNT